MYCIFQARTDKRFVEWKHHISVLVFKIAGNESKYSIGGFLSIFLFAAATRGFGDGVAV